jgi:hypothetical protein
MTLSGGVTGRLSRVAVAESSGIRLALLALVSALRPLLGPLCS